MYLTVKQKLKHLSKEEINILRELSHTAKNLMNEAIYNVRQHYDKSNDYLGYFQNCMLLKESKNYKILNSNVAQQIIKEVDKIFKAYFGLLKASKKSNYYQKDINVPHYLPKDGFATIVIADFTISNNSWTLPFSRGYLENHNRIRIKIPPILEDKRIKIIRIVPKANGKYFEACYVYEAKEDIKILSKEKALGIDLGVNNLATCVTSTGESFIIDGRRLKSINQWYNKENARLRSLQSEHKIKKRTNKEYQNDYKRERRVDDYILKAARYIIDYCIDNDIGIVVCGFTKELQTKTDLGKRNNQNFVFIPLGKLRMRLESLCKYYGITYIKQEESYTSKASFFDNDRIPDYREKGITDSDFSGKRIKRGLYQTKNGYCFNADCNAALNILRKSNCVSLETLSTRGELNTPVRVKIK